MILGDSNLQEGITCQSRDAVWDFSGLRIYYLTDLADTCQKVGCILQMLMCGWGCRKKQLPGIASCGQLLLCRWLHRHWPSLLLYRWIELELDVLEHSFQSMLCSGILLGHTQKYYLAINRPTLPRIPQCCHVP